jgi:hypothetical protein
MDYYKCGTARPTRLKCCLWLSRRLPSKVNAANLYRRNTRKGQKMLEMVNKLKNTQSFRNEAIGTVFSLVEELESMITDDIDVFGKLKTKMKIKEYFDDYTKGDFQLAICNGKVIIKKCIKVKCHNEYHNAYRYGDISFESINTSSTNYDIEFINTNEFINAIMELLEKSVSFIEEQNKNYKYFINFYKNYEEKKEK